ncbi:MAG: protein kinase [Acidobacteriota bacterium]
MTQSVAGSMVGRRLGSFQILERLGEGGSGRVYLAEDTRLGRRVALKILPIGGGRRADDPPLKPAQETVARQRFEREARAAAAFSHPHIVTLYSMEEVDDVPFLTMELVQGRTLADLTPADGFELPRLLALSRQLVEAVAAVHRRGVHHRDLKPENVMVTTEEQVKVLDFGLARLIRLTGPHGRPLGNGDLPGELQTEDVDLPTRGPGDPPSVDLSFEAGTAAYLAPEQIRGEAGDQRSDLFALGVVLFRMSAGRLPFEGETPMAILSSVLSREPLSLRSLRPDLPEAWERLVRRCLAKNPTDRPASAEELLGDLDRLASRRRPRRRLLGWAFALALVVMAGLGVDRWRSSAPPSTATYDEGPRRVAVLPFRSLGPEDTEYFGAGVAEEIQSRLVTVPGLVVLTPNGPNGEASPVEVGADLGAELVLAGTALWSRDGGEERVRVTPTLLRVSDGATVWSRTYDRVMRDIFEVQSEIARQVIGQLDLTLFPEHGRRLGASRVTPNLEAYRAYLQGLEMAGSTAFEAENSAHAIRLFQRAVDLDPSFLLGYTQLAYAHAAHYHFGHDRSPQRRAAAAAAAERARELGPDTVEADLASAFVLYWVERDYGEATRRLGRVLVGRPGDLASRKLMAFVQRRRGRFEAALDSLERAAVLAPKDLDIPREIASTLVFLRRYDEALGHYEEAVAVAPDSLFARHTKVRALLLATGRTDEARAEMAQVGDPDDPRNLWFDLWFDIYDGDPQAALDRLDGSDLERFQTSHLNLPVSLVRGWALELLGRTDEARRAHAEALRWVDAQVDGGAEEDPRLHAARAHALAGLGRGHEALASARRAVELIPTARDAVFGPYYLEDLALVQVRSGHLRRACDTLETLLSIPAQVSLPWVRLDPRWTPLLDASPPCRVLGSPPGDRPEGGEPP